MNRWTSLCFTGLVGLWPATALAQDGFAACTDPGWIDKDDAAFAADCAGMAFSAILEDRETVAWMLFARVNQLIADSSGDGMSGTGQVPEWMAWPTDPDTFDPEAPRFAFAPTPRTAMRPSHEKKDLTAGAVATATPDDANEEVTRNRISYDYLVDNGLTTRAGVATYFETRNAVDMPIGTVELKASWLQVTEGSPAPDGALTFAFDSGTYWWRGLHVMVKMQRLPNPAEAFYSEAPSWFWTTFEFTDNPGAVHVRDFLITQRAPLPSATIAALLDEADLTGFGLEAYAPNGTQIRFTAGGAGTVPVILGHTDMEDFAGAPNTAQPAYWTHFQSSCHSCHATASYNPEDQSFFPISSPTGALDPGYNASDSDDTTRYLGQGYRPLDFMWPIAFQAK